MVVDEPIEVVPYNKSWSTSAHAEITRLSAALSAWKPGIEHIGSTAVPGCAAKPIVDLMIGAETEVQDAVADDVAQAGYESLGQAAPGRIYLRRRQDLAFNVHVVEIGGSLWHDNLVLRAYLRADRDERDRYALAKRAAAADEPMLLAYSRLKEPVLTQLLDRARRWSSG
jgi:GrpB-like predicted nucleotidyltransferase (UPF0157 family)